MSRPNYKIYCDLDGVLAGFKEYYFQQFGLEFDENTPAEILWAPINDYYQKYGAWYLDLPVRKDAHVLWNYIRPLGPEILTATGNRPDKIPTASEEKKLWFPKHFTPINTKVITVERSFMKAEYAAPGIILIDDSPKSINPWRAKGGIGIQHTSAEDTIRQLEELFKHTQE